MENTWNRFLQVMWNHLQPRLPFSTEAHFAEFQPPFVLVVTVRTSFRFNIGSKSTAIFPETRINLNNNGQQDHGLSDNVFAGCVWPKKSTVEALD